mmetsp:Transcript_53612/g.156263  ORF Transcript_53612/g.156263 Transcript_53612/m.156263 type:complete len:722 (+) Transcript_53612:66-2231(+)
MVDSTTPLPCWSGAVTDQAQLQGSARPCQQSGAASSPLGQHSIQINNILPFGREVSMMQEVLERMETVRKATHTSGEGAVSHSQRLWLATSPTRDANTPVGSWSESPSGHAANAAILAPVYVDTVDLGSESVSPKRTVSFRRLVISANIFVVLLTCALMFITIEVASTSIQNGVIHSCSKAMAMQQAMVDQLIDHNITVGSFRSKIRSCETMVEQLIQLPADRAAHALSCSLRSMRHVDASWHQHDNTQLQRLAYRSWAELERPWNMTSPGWGDVRSLQLASHAPLQTATDLLSVHFLGGESTGFQIIQQGTRCPASGPALCGECEGWCTWLAAETFTSGPAVNGSTTVTYWATDPATGRQLHALRSRQLDPGAQTPGVAVQLRQAALAQAMPGGAASVPARPLWSGLYVQSGVMRFSWTLPISPCGNYSCLEGVVEAGMTLRGVSWHCAVLWERLKLSLASPTYNFHIGNQNSSLFIVHVTPEASPEGVLIGTSDAYPINARIRAENAPQEVVRATSRALLARFGSWNASELVEREHLLAFRRHRAMDWELQECGPTSHDMRAQGCQQVGTRAISLDERTWWLVVASLPAGAFNGPAARSTMMADEQVAQLHGQSQQELHQARVAGAIAIVLIVGTSVGLGLCLACLVSEPLRRLSGLMQQLEDFDFQEDSAELATLRSGRHACIANVHELQAAFCRLLGGVEAFARFVPKTVVTRIVCA